MRDAWRLERREPLYDARIFRLWREFYRYRGAEPRPYYVLEAGDWVNVVALTESGEVVLVRQFRHGIRDLSLEIPGGMVDPGDDDPAAAAARELLEETGYAGARPEEILKVSSNPAILSNHTWTSRVRDPRPVAPPAPDEHEDLELVLVPLDSVGQLIATGVIHHSLSVAALLRHLREPDT